MEATEEIALLWRQRIWGRLMAESARDLSDETLSRALGPCVGGKKLIPLARLLRDAGLLSLDEEPPAA